MKQQLIDSLRKENYSIKIIKNNKIEEKFVANGNKLSLLLEGVNAPELIQLSVQDLQNFKEIRVFNLQEEIE